jgi:hypothetical protein
MNVFNDHFISRQLYPHTYFTHVHVRGHTLVLDSKRSHGRHVRDETSGTCHGRVSRVEGAKEKGTDVFYTRLVTASRTLSDTNSVMLCL